MLFYRSNRLSAVLKCTSIIPLLCQERVFLRRTCASMTVPVCTLLDLLERALVENRPFNLALQIVIPFSACQVACRASTRNIQYVIGMKVALSANFWMPFLKTSWSIDTSWYAPVTLDPTQGFASPATPWALNWTPSAHGPAFTSRMTPYC